MRVFSCQGAAGAESMSAGMIWGKSAPPRTKGHLHTGVPGTAPPWGPEPPPIKCFSPPAQRHRPVRGASPGAMLEHPQRCGEPRICPQPCSVPGAEGSARATLAEHGGGVPRLAPHGPTAPTGVGGAAPTPGPSRQRRVREGAGGGPCSLSPLAEAAWPGPRWGRWVQGAGREPRGVWGAAGSGGSAIRRGLS